MIEYFESSLPRVLVWMNMPSHHQSTFFREVRNQGVDLVVCYYGEVDWRRKSMGWNVESSLSGYEYFFSPDHSLEFIKDWRDRVHIVPGYGSEFLCRLVRKLSNDKINWAHWSEKAHPGLRWYLTYPIKHWYARMVNSHAIGAFGCGNLAVEDFVHWGIKREKIGLLPYSPECFQVVKSENESSLNDVIKSRKVFLYIGCLEKRKGIDLLLKAFSEATKSYNSSDWILVLVGNDLSAGRYASSARKLGIEDSTFFVGVIPVAEISAVHMMADVFILPSRFDGWGAVVSESAAHGKALIVSDQCGAAQHLVDPGVNGFVVEAGNWRSLAKAMQAYISSPDLAYRHGKASPLIYERFAPQNNAKRFVEILCSWLATNYKVLF